MPDREQSPPRFPGIREGGGGGNVVPDWAAWLTAQRDQKQIETFYRPVADDLNRVSAPKQSGVATIAGPGSLLPVVYGRARIESGRVFAVAQNTTNAVFGIAWCLGEVEEVVSVTINDANTPTGVDVYNYTGTSSQTADATLAAAITDYDDDLPGICYSVVVIPWNAEIAGFPVFNAVIKGMKILVGEGGGPTYTENPAYILRDFITNMTYGMGALCDWDSTDIAAAHCDDPVDLDPGPGTEKRHELNIVLDRSLPGVEWLNNLRDYARIFCVPEGNTYYLIPDIAGVSVRDFTESDVVEGSLQITAQGSSGSPTMIECVYTDSSQIPYAEGTYMTAADTPRRVSRVLRPGILRYSEAVRYAEDRLTDLSVQLQFSWVTFDEALKVQAGDIVTLEHSVGVYDTRDLRVMSIDQIQPGLWRINAVPAPTTISPEAPPPPETLPPLGPPDINWGSGGSPWDVYGRETTTTPTESAAYLQYYVYTITDNTFKDVRSTKYQPLPPVSFAITIMYQGPNDTLEDIVFTLNGGVEDVLFISSPYDGSGSEERGYAYICEVYSLIQDYDASLLGHTFSIFAQASGHTATPDLICAITALGSPMIVSPYLWSGSFYKAGTPGVLTSGWQFDPYPTAGDYHNIRISGTPGYDWEGPTANITWTINQTEGPTLPITIAHDYGWNWKVTFQDGSHYNGTIYEIQFYTNSGNDEFGPLITLSDWSI